MTDEPQENERACESVLNELLCDDEFSTLRDEIYIATTGLKTDPSWMRPARIGKQERDNIGKRAVLRLNRIERNLNSMVNVCNNSLEVVLKCVNGETLLDTEGNIKDIESCLHVMKLIIGRNMK